MYAKVSPQTGPFLALQVLKESGMDGLTSDMFAKSSEKGRWQEGCSGEQGIPQLRATATLQRRQSCHCGHR